MSRVTYLGLLLAVVLGLGGCSDPSDDPGPAAPTSSPSPTTTPTAPTAPTAPTPPAPVAVADYCADSDTAGLTSRRLRSPAGDVQHYATGGSGPTTVVLLHQTNGNGLCGFTDFAQVLLGRGFRVVLLDLCGYGQSTCSSDLTTDPRAQVRAVVDQARAVTGRDAVRRLVLVGASMGGSVATHVAAEVRADAVVDLSGPVQFLFSDLDVDAATLTMPVLFAYSPTDSADLETVRTLLPRVPAQQKRLVTAESGHGYELLDAGSAVSRAVLGWIAGRY